jgi:predicted nucleic acid-binding Zn ribbon protein
MKSLGEIFKQKNKKTPLMRGVLAAGAVELVNIFIQQNIAEGSKLARAIYLKNSTLVIACLSSLMAQEIKLREKEIIKQINEKCGQGTVLKIRYVY